MNSFPQKNGSQDSVSWNYDWMIDPDPQHQHEYVKPSSWQEESVEIESSSDSEDANTERCIFMRSIHHQPVSSNSMFCIPYIYTLYVRYISFILLSIFINLYYQLLFFLKCKYHQRQYRSIVQKRSFRTRWTSSSQTCFCSLKLQPCDPKSQGFGDGNLRFSSPQPGRQRHESSYQPWGRRLKQGNGRIRVKENRNHAETNWKMYEHGIERGEVHIFTREDVMVVMGDGCKKFEGYPKLRHQRTGKDFVHRCLFALFQNRGQCRAQHADRATFAWRRFLDAYTNIYIYIYTYTWYCGIPLQRSYCMW